MYSLLTGNVVSEIIPDEDPVFPGVPIERRYAPSICAKLLHVQDDAGVEQNWVYDPDTQTFSEPATPPCPEEPSGDTIATADLDAAYREGVNSYE